jgi:hypothetical protein
LPIAIAGLLFMLKMDYTCIVEDNPAAGIHWANVEITGLRGFSRRSG